MRDWKEALVRKDESLLTTMKIIDSCSLQIALVVNEFGQLLGTITDGDIRKAILRGSSLDEQVMFIMNKNPIFARVNESREVILSRMTQKKVNQIPILDEENRLVGLEILNDIVEIDEKDNLVFLLAGGLGSRLGVLTKDCPKPLLHIGNKPVLETIIESFIENGYRNFCLSVNYKADMIKDYFKDGRDLGVNISYVCEKKRMGTAGSLSLLLERPSKPILVMNGDILTKVNFNQLLKFHEDHHVKATMCVRDYSIQVPYGVVQMDDHRLTGIIEKPSQSYFVSAGIYVLNPEMLDLIPANDFYDMPDLFKNMIELNHNVSAFPVREYWIDIGRMSDYEKANGDFAEMFP